MVRFPSWDEFVSKLGSFEQKVNDSVGKFKENHPLLDKAIKQSLPLLPPPFNAIAGQIYDSFEGSEEDKTNEMLSYFNYLKSRGQKNYEQLATKLDAVLIDVSD